MRPGLRATLVIAAIAVASGLAGAAIDRTFLVHPRRHGLRPMGSDSLAVRAAMRAEMLDRLAKELSLKPEQRQAIDSVFQRTDSTMHAIRTEMQPRIQQAIERSRADISVHLDSVQRAKFRKISAERDRERRAMRS